MVKLDALERPRVSLPPVVEMIRRADLPIVCSGTDALEVKLCGYVAEKVFRNEESYKNEVDVLARLLRANDNRAHPNIVVLLWAEAATLTVGLRQCAGGDLMHRLMRDDGTVCAEKVARGLLRAVAHCHGASVVHRDLKPENVLLGASDDAVLCDFARSVVASEPLSLPFNGTYAFAAPEALQGRCMFANDLWSMGMVLFCLCERVMPWDDTVTAEQHLHAAHLNPEFDEEAWRATAVTRWLRPVVPALLDIDPSRRPSARGLLGDALAALDGAEQSTDTAG